MFKMKLLSFIYRSIGSLLNAGLEEIIQKILCLTDISAEMSGQFCSLFNQVIIMPIWLSLPLLSGAKFSLKSEKPFEF